MSPPSVCCVPARYLKPLSPEGYFLSTTEFVFGRARVAMTVVWGPSKAVPLVRRARDAASFVPLLELRACRAIEATIEAMRRVDPNAPAMGTKR